VATWKLSMRFLMSSLISAELSCIVVILVKLKTVNRRLLAISSKFVFRRCSG
jgi:hypothetical protein